MNYLLAEIVLPRLDTGHLAQTLHGAMRLEAVRGVWAILVALTAAILLLIALAWRHLPHLRGTRWTPARSPRWRRSSTPRRWWATAR